MANAPTSGQRWMANALPLGHRKLVNPPPYPGGGPSGIYLILPLAEAPDPRLSYHDHDTGENAIQRLSYPVPLGHFSLGYGRLFAKRKLKCKWHENFYCPITKSFKSLKDCRLPFLNIVSSSKVIYVKRFVKRQKTGTKNARSWIKSIKIDKICDVMWWTSDSKPILNYTMSLQILVWIIWNFNGGNYKTLCKRSLKKIGCHSDDVGPRPLQWISWNEA